VLVMVCMLVFVDGFVEGEGCVRVVVVVCVSETCVRV
jgi:hypothetical protein